MRKTPKTEYLWEARTSDVYSEPIYFLSDSADVKLVDYPTKANRDLKPIFIGEAKRYLLYEYIGLFYYKNGEKDLRFYKLTKRRIALAEREAGNLYILGDKDIYHRAYSQSHNIYNDYHAHRPIVSSISNKLGDTYNIEGLYVTQESNKKIVRDNIEKIIKKALLEFVTKQQQCYASLFQDLKEDESETLPV